MNTDKCIFNDFVGVGGNFKYINPIKQKDVKEILSVLPDTLEELWIFGSSTTDKCQDNSDIDICLVGNTTRDEEKRIYMKPKSAVEIIKETPEGFLLEQNYGGSIYKIVKDTGVLLYKKGKGVVNG